MNFACNLLGIFKSTGISFVTCFVVPRYWCLKRKSNRTNRNIEILPKDSKNDHKCTQTL